jgi:hypothetical protein
MNDTKTRAFEADLKAIDRRFNTRLFLLLGIGMPLGLLYDRSSFKTGLLDLSFAGIFALALVGLIIGLAHAKNRTCEKYDLVCPHCGKSP